MSGELQTEKDVFWTEYLSEREVRMLSHGNPYVYLILADSVALPMVSSFCIYQYL